MAVRRLPSSLLLILPYLAVGLGCAKSNPTSAEKTAPTPKADLAGACESAVVDALLSQIAREETAKTELETIAKRAPEKANFRKLYDAEAAFASATGEKVSRLEKCGSAAAAAADLRTKLARSRANLTYLRESFPEFK